MISGSGKIYLIKIRFVYSINRNRRRKYLYRAIYKCQTNAQRDLKVRIILKINLIKEQNKAHNQEEDIYDRKGMEDDDEKKINYLCVNISTFLL